MPTCFGAIPSVDAMCFAGTVVSLRICLLDTQFSMTFMIEEGSLRADGRFSPRMNCGGHV